MPFGGPFFSHEEIFDKKSTLEEIRALLCDLDPIPTFALLCQINTDLRLVTRERKQYGALQSEFVGGLLDDDTMARLKLRFAQVHCGDRPVFHPTQVLNLMRLATQICSGNLDPFPDSEARYKVGAACLMMNDLFLTAEEKTAISTGDEDTRRRALMSQMLGPFEIVNTQAITHLLYRSSVMFRILLSNHRVTERIRKVCCGFDFEREFLNITGISLTTYLFLIFLAYSYFLQYQDESGQRNHTFLGIDRTVFRGESNITADELDSFLRAMSLPFNEFKNLLSKKRPVDWRYDFTPFKGKPLVELHPNKYFCSDLGFLIEKMHSGVYWTLFDGVKDRPQLSQAWGILFEEYVNWFLRDRHFTASTLFFPSPEWSNGGESFDGALIQDSRFMPMEYKGKVLKLEARYSGDPSAFESDMDLKIVEGCEQLAKKIQGLFHIVEGKRRRLKDVSLDHVTRVLPVLVVQDHILRGPFVNWRLNQSFLSILDRGVLRPTVTVEPLNVVGIQELETMAESAEGGSFDIFQGLQMRCLRDPEMKSELQEFLSGMPGYGSGKSNRVEQLVQDQFEELQNYSFGKSE